MAAEVSTIIACALQGGGAFVPESAPPTGRVNKGVAR
jgi:hypothetical protein